MIADGQGSSKQLRKIDSTASGKMIADRKRSSKQLRKIDSTASAKMVADSYYHTVTRKSLVHEQPLMTEDETEVISVSWDYLIGHVGIKVSHR